MKMFYEVTLIDFQLLWVSRNPTPQFCC